LFDGQLPDLNLGTNNGASCSPELSGVLTGICQQQSQFSHVLNGRFKGGYITRAYGQPAADIHAVQLELAQVNYMDETPPYAWSETRPSIADAVKTDAGRDGGMEANSMAIKGEKADVPVSSA
jgi:formiminoglutamase